MKWVALLLLLSGCVINTSPDEAPPPASQSCPATVAPIIVTPPKPVWPDSCVADWYAKASLPPCVESYLRQLKTQQKTIAKKRNGK